MTDERRDDLIAESVLRLGLRLDADERVPRFDPAAIAALAGPRMTPPFVLGTIVLAAAVAMAATMLWWSAITGGAAFAGDLGALAIGVVAYVAPFVYAALEAWSDPAIPLSLLVALGLAIVHETRLRRERAHAEAA